MKVLLVALLVAAVSAVPLPDEDAGAVEMIVNGVPDGEALDIAHIVDISLKEHNDAGVVATNLLHPYTAVGIAEAAAAAAAEESVLPAPVALPEPVAPEVVIPEPVVLPEPVVPEVVIPQPVVLPEAVLPEVVIPEPVVLPEPVLPEVVIPQPVVLPEPVAPEVVPEPVVLPEPVAPEVVMPEPVILPEPVAPEVIVASPATPEILPSPAAQDNEVYNDGVVSVTVNAPEDQGVLSTLQSWFSMVMNYFGDGVQTTQQIV